MGDIAFNKLTTAKVLRGSGIKKYLAVAVASSIIDGVTGEV